MDKKSSVHIGYTHLDDAMKRVITVPYGFSFVMFDDIVYSIQMLEKGELVHDFGRNGTIIMDGYGRHWFRRVFAAGGMETIETYEPLPAEVVSEEYVAKRIPDMMIYPFIRLDRARELVEIYEASPRWSDEEPLSMRILEINGKI